MGSHEKDESDMDCEDENLHPSRFVNMSADVYTEAQVLEYTEVCEMYCISSFFFAS